MIAPGGLSSRDFYGHASGGRHSQRLINLHKTFRGNVGGEIHVRGIGIGLLSGRNDHLGSLVAILGSVLLSLASGRRKKNGQRQ